MCFIFYCVVGGPGEYSLLNSFTLVVPRIPNSFRYSGANSVSNVSSRGFELCWAKNYWSLNPTFSFVDKGSLKDVAYSTCFFNRYSSSSVFANSECIVKTALFNFFPIFPDLSKSSFKLDINLLAFYFRSSFVWPSLDYICL